MIQINRFKQQRVKLYSPTNELIGTIIGEESFNDVRLQIRREGLVGYYIIFKNHKVEFNSKGYPLEWPDGLFDSTIDQLNELLGI